MGAPTCRFNGAALDRERKGARVWSGHRRRQASTGPLSIESGRLVRDPMLPGVVELQRGRSRSRAEGRPGAPEGVVRESSRFNGAALDRERKAPGSVSDVTVLIAELQRGRSRSRAEGGAIGAGQGRRGLLASTGPLSIESGRTTDYKDASSDGNASTGPLSIESGRLCALGGGHPARGAASTGPLSIESGRGRVRDPGRNPVLGASTGPLSIESGRGLSPTYRNHEPYPTPTHAGRNRPRFRGRRVRLSILKHRPVASIRKLSQECTQAP